ncbi:cation:proton antiporter [Roseimaritima ulvae]|uniref:Inner membrane protein YbaL n=1 Tax=Roseimaritima ulvae TaxID=980254 RepID=A0A5B9QWN0_9BACT|nr:cation:proton antiporter [Roseimaritima ulvae]QEG41516.1 Inner membrane protein YbaL [Roseimaritima ulvae]
MTQNLLHDLLLILAGGLLAGLVCRWLHVSVLIGYLLVGVLLGQGALSWVADGGHQLESFAEAGVFLLLFSIGLEFSLDDLKRLGGQLLIGGATQMTLVAFPLGMLLVYRDMQWQSAVMVASAIAFSSTVMVFKALSECGQSEQPHGVRAIGILLFQDAALVPLLLLVPLLTGDHSVAGAAEYLRLAVSSLLFVVAIGGLRYLLSHWLIPMFAGYRSPELVILFTIVSLGSVILAAHTLGLPPAVGAFAAGLIFNGNRWTKQIDSLVLPFRETFTAIFFVSLGLILDPHLWWEQPIWMAAMLLGVIVLKTLAASVALRLTGLSMRHAVGMGVGLAHVGEFAFVLVLLGVEAGVVFEADYQRVVSLAVGSLILTPPLLRAGLRLIDRQEPNDAAESPQDSRPTAAALATVIGAGPVGRQLASQLEIMGHDVCLIDFSPINLHPFALEGFRTISGDATEVKVLRVAKVAECQMVVVCVPNDESAIGTVRAVRKINPEAMLIVRCRYQGSVNKLTAAGADRVVSEETEVSTALLRALLP